jgi:hypothetical protein
LAPVPDSSQPARQPYTAQPGDSIPTILGTSDPVAIEAFLNANQLSSSTIYAGRTYQLPGDADYAAASGALGQSVLNADNVLRQTTEADAQAASSTSGSVPPSTSGLFGTDTEKQAVYDAAIANGQKPADALETSNLVDIRRQVDDLSNRISALSLDDPTRVDLVKTRAVLTDALVSKDVYFNNSIQGILPSGVSRLNDTDLQALGVSLKNADFVDNASGYFGALYVNQNATGDEASYIYANRGTESGAAGIRDWINNLQQATGFASGQFRRAIDIGTVLAAQLNGDLTFTGHSLGGGLASAQALATNLTAITYNAEGLSNGTISRFKLDTSQAANLVTAFYVNGEILSRAQDNPATNVLTDSPSGIAIKNGVALGNAIDSLFNGQKPDWSSFGLPTVQSAVGTREQLPAVDLEGTSLGALDRLKNTISLHFMNYVLESLQVQVNSTATGTLPAKYLSNVH